MGKLLPEDGRWKRAQDASTVMAGRSRQVLTDWLPSADWDWESGDELITVPETLRAYRHLWNVREELINALIIGAVRAIALKAYIIVAQHEPDKSEYSERIKSEHTILQNSYIRGNRGVVHEPVKVRSSFWSEEMLNADDKWLITENFYDSAYSSNWDTGTFTVAHASWQVDDEGFESTWLIRLFGIRFLKRDVDIVFAGETPQFVTGEFSKDDAGQSRTGGRRAAKHGEPIAKVTLRLAKLPPNELSKYTAESLALELRQQYINVGENPPGEQSCRQFAQGILRALRN